MKKQNLSTTNLAVLGILGAILIIMSFTPLGIIPLPGSSATILHIPVIIGTLVLGPKLGLALGGMMGLTTLVRAIIAPASPLDLFFRNPIVSVVPRLFIGVLAYYAYKGVKKWLKKEVPALVVAGIVGSLANSVLTLGTLLLVYYKPLGEMSMSEMGVTAFGFIGVILTTSAIGEMIVSGVLVPPIQMALKKVYKRRT